MVTPVGPLFAAGQTDITKSGYKITFLPDAHNDELQRAGLPAQYYWMPNEVRLAQKDNGDYKFSMIHFAGVRSSDTTIGATSTDDEVAGGMLTFSTTASPPGEVLREAQQDLLNQLRGNGDKFWGLRSNVPPNFRFFPIVSNTTTVANLSPSSDGGIPTPAPAPAAGPAPGAPAAAGPAGPAGAPGAPPGGRGLMRSLPPQIRGVPVLMPRPMPLTVPRGYRGSNLDPTFVRMSGQGPGSVSPDAENAYSALMGSIAAAIVYNGFHMGTSPVAVYQNMMTRVVSPLMTIDITGSWQRIQDHFSAAAHAGGLFWSADIQAQFDSLRESGDIQVNTFVDASLPGADKLQAYMDQRSDLVFQKFMDLAKTVIFDPAPFQEQPAQAQGGLSGALGSIFGGGSVAMKLRTQRTSLQLEYHETKEMAYLQSYPISGTMDGLYEAIKADPAQEKKYFLNVDLGDWDRKVARIVKPVVNWPDPAQKWVGEPVAFLSAQIGYPNADGVVQWDGHVFGPTDGPAAQWNTAMALKHKEDVANPPDGWDASKTFVKRQIHFTEPPSALENPYARVQVEKDLVDLDPDDLGTLSDLITLEIRVEDTGTLAVGPIILGAMLDAPSQIVEVTLRGKGKRADGNDREPVKLSWMQSDQDQPRYWLLYTGQLDFAQTYEYQVHVVVRGSLLTKGMEWTGPWTDGAASGPLTVSVPTPDDPGVVKKDVPLAALAGDHPAAAAPHATTPPPSGSPATPHAPPPTGSRPATPPPPTGGRAPRSAPPAVGAKRTISDLAGWSYGNGSTGSRDLPPADSVVFTGFEPAHAE